MDRMTKDQIVLVTGASSGIGSVVANNLHSLGYEVYGTSRQSQEKKSFTWLTLDVNQETSVTTAINSLIDRHGKIDVLINNAGLAMISALEEAPSANIDKVMNTNFGGVVRMIQAVLPHMRRQTSGKIINVSSIAGLMGLPYRSIYSASKFAVEGLTESLRTEVMKFGIQVCSIQPGSIKTDIKANRVSHIPEDSAYNPELERTAKIIDEEVAAGIDALEVAKMISRLLKKSQWRAKYVVAKPFQIGVTKARPLVPGGPFEKLLMNHYGIARKSDE